MNHDPLIDLAEIFGDRPTLKALARPLLTHPLERLLDYDRLNEVHEGIGVRRKFSPDRSFYDRALDELGTRYHLASGSLASIPETGATFVVSNHPFGAIDGLVLGSLMAARRPDFKLLTNRLLARIPEMREQIIPVDPFGTEASRRENLVSLREAGRWLKDGHCLATFPAGFVALQQPGDDRPRDREWHPNIGRLARKFDATVVPIWFEGNNSALFQALGRVHPKLRMLMLVRELFHPDRRRIDLHIGSPIEAHKFAEIPGDRALIRYFRMRSEVLQHRRPPTEPAAITPTEPELEPVVDRLPVEKLIADVESLPAECLLHRQGVHHVYAATGDQIPHLLHEIGRTRELTFRSVGEGVGLPIDLDRFDPIYHHLFLWNDETCEIVGAYRIGLVNDIIAKHGLDGLYTHKVIDYHRDAFDALGPGGVLELGRSYIVPAYQRRGTSLFLLWRGIVKFVRKHPGYSKLFGTVSISDRYHPMSQALLIEWMKKHAADPALQRRIRARKPSRFEGLKGVEAFDDPEALPSPEKLGSLIAELEPDGKGFPVLLKHYLQLNGEILGVGVDENFGEVLDGFILVDLEKIAPQVLQKYEGRPDRKART